MIHIISCILGLEILVMDMICISHHEIFRHLIGGWNHVTIPIISLNDYNLGG